MPQQLEQIEAQRGQMGEQMYQQVKRSMEPTANFYKKQREAWAAMPQPTATEQAALDRYHDQLMGLMMEGEEEWE